MMNISGVNLRFLCLTYVKKIYIVSNNPLLNQTVLMPSQCIVQNSYISVLNYSSVHSRDPVCVMFY